MQCMNAAVILKNNNGYWTGHTELNCYFKKHYWVPITCETNVANKSEHRENITIRCD